MLRLCCLNLNLIQNNASYRIGMKLIQMFPRFQR